MGNEKFCNFIIVHKCTCLRKNQIEIIHAHFELCLSIIYVVIKKTFLIYILLSMQNVTIGCHYCPTFVIETLGIHLSFELLLLY